MANFNRVILVGNLTRDPEVKYTQSGTAVCEVGLAINRKYKDEEETTFVDVTLWARQAEVISEYAGKGRPVMIEGRLQQDTWEQDGKKRSKLKVVCENLQLLGGKGGQVSSGQSAPAQSRGRDEEAVPF